MKKTPKISILICSMILLFGLANAAHAYDTTDFTNLVADWLKTISSSPADVNSDGKVNSRDLGIMMSNWGSVSPTPTPEAGWTFCANEDYPIGTTGEYCSFSGTKEVRFGANGSYLYKIATNGVPCTIAEFGSDPIVSTPKQCHYRDTDVVPTPTPTPETCGNGACAGGENCTNCPRDCGSCGGGSNINVTPAQDDRVLLNPGKGWVLYAPFSQHSSDTWNIGTLCYNRYEWDKIELSQGNFQWNIIDNDLNTCVAHGKKFSFGIMTANSSGDGNAVPQYVWDAGAQYRVFNIWDNTGSNGREVKSPIFNDPVFIAKHTAFLRALGAKYDGNQNIEYIDIRSYGNWGENHVEDFVGVPQLTSTEWENLHAIPYKEAFPNTKLVTASSYEERNFSTHDSQATWQWSVDNNIGLRWDGFFYDSGNGGTGYALSKSRGRDFGIAEAGQGFGDRPDWYANYDYFRSQLSDGQVSYMSLANWGSDADNFYNSHPSLVRELANKLGYWYRLTEASFSSNLGNGAQGNITFKIKNDGYAPMYLKNTYVKLALLDASGNVLSTTGELAGLDPFDWKPGETTTETANFSFPHNAAGSKLGFGVFSKSSLSNPDIQLGSAGRLASGWYVLE